MSIREITSSPVSSGEGSPNSSERPAGAQVAYLLFHYTVFDLERTLKVFNDPACKVSAHYVVSLEGDVHETVPETRAAWHAGLSSWGGQESLNGQSIGIEIINDGYRERDDQDPGQVVQGDDREWYSYTEAQVEALERLSKEIINRHGIRPENVVGHSDVAPLRKLDPGPLFPWQELARRGVGRWYDLRKTDSSNHIPAIGSGEERAWAAEKLEMVGYALPNEEAFGQVVRAFHMHFRPTNICEELNEESLSILAALTQK